MEPPRVSFVVPVRDEAESVAPLVLRLEATIGALAGGAEAIFVDDGSADGTARALAEAAATRPWLRVLALRRGAGKSAALAAGFARARGERIVTLDGDLQDDPREAPRLLAELDRGADVAVGWRRERRDPLGKRLPSAAFNLLVRALTGTRFRDVNSGLKAMPRAVALECDLYGERHRLIPVIAALSGRRVAEVPVEHAPRLHGRSKYGPGRFGRGLLDLLTIAFLARYGLRPAHFFGLAGLAVGGAGAAISLYLAWLRLATGSIQSRFPLLALGVTLLVLGFQLVTTGFLAELIVAARRRPGAAQAADELAPAAPPPASAEPAPRPSAAARAAPPGEG
jgi:dolichol-phosphate mannosyltransferase